MSCCPVNQALPPHYHTVRIACASVITSLALRVFPALFFASAIAGFCLQALMGKNLAVLTKAEAVASGCTDIVGQSYGLKFDSRLSLVIAALFFCCHLEHHSWGMVPVVAGALGCRLFEVIH